jgi:hypothetical protein
MLRKISIKVSRKAALVGSKVSPLEASRIVTPGISPYNSASGRLTLANQQISSLSAQETFSAWKSQELYKWNCRKHYC